MTYMQMVMGFFAGYLVIAYVLLPSIIGSISPPFMVISTNGLVATHTKQEHGFSCSQKLLEQLRLYLVAFICSRLCSTLWVCLSLSQLLVLSLSFGCIATKWNKNNYLTDWLQTLLFFTALVLIYGNWPQMGLDFRGVVTAVSESPHSRSSSLKVGLALKTSSSNF